jgi:hypothetical protein
VAAVAWQVEPRLASEQVSDVMVRSAHQTVGNGGNEITGAGIVDGAAATALARAYDVSAPSVHAKARRRDGLISVRVRGSKDRTEPGRELAGRVTYGLVVSSDGGRDFATVVRQRRRPFSKAIRIRGAQPNVLVAAVCDGNGNCGVKRLGRFWAR